MATSENSSLETSNMVQQDPPNDTVMDEQVDTTISDPLGTGSHDSEDENTAQAEKDSDAGSSFGGAETSDDKSDGSSNAGSKGDHEGKGDGSDAESNAGDDEDESDEEEESFESYSLKVAQLCRDLGYGEPLKIEDMKAGGFHKIVGLSVGAPLGSDLILRIPKWMDDSESADFLDQVAIPSYFSNYDFLHGPKIVAYDSTENNALGALYVLQERFAGVPAGEVFYTRPLAEKLQITTLVAETLTKLESIRLEKPGRLGATSSLAPKYIGSPLAAELNIGPYRFSPLHEMPVVEKQPLRGFFISLFEILKQRDNYLEDKCDRLIEITKEMESAGFIRTTDTECVPWHWDFSSNNIMVHRQESTKAAVVGMPASNKGCQHSVKVKFEDGDPQGTRNTIHVEVEDNSGRNCSHKIEIAIEHSPGKKYRHTINLTGSADTDNHIANTPFDSTSQDQGIDNSMPGPWSVSGVIDWDDVLSVPLVLARKPPSWL
ncbi:hypothetical protein LHYA1_G004736 [Lachnellula hyalina]|uniref:Aminoglycoside phosphotransferase domain-containing protein n=1 Tax=Lachnellula hyalina TaxID=1316788 RepID=A0A8H8R287_9HELO|nr:uncharacterized protein LHYA1_G004736 [Lachnellula hyalina]TVY26731.1 hypothetical protein LHYA1_G004736 [Lachnellula hyalina]